MVTWPVKVPWISYVLLLQSWGTFGSELHRVSLGQQKQQHQHQKQEIHFSLDWIRHFSVSKTTRRVWGKSKHSQKMEMPVAFLTQTETNWVSTGQEKKVHSITQSQPVLNIVRTHSLTTIICPFWRKIHWKSSKRVLKGWAGNNYSEKQLFFWGSWTCLCHVQIGSWRHAC